MDGGSVRLWSPLPPGLTIYAGQQRALTLIHPHSKAVLDEAIRNDCEFLAESNIMDYSCVHLPIGSYFSSHHHAASCSASILLTNKSPAALSIPSARPPPTRLPDNADSTSSRKLHVRKDAGIQGQAGPQPREASYGSTSARIPTALRQCHGELLSRMSRCVSTVLRCAAGTPSDAAPSCP
jgi:hypothetical protein